MKGNDVDVRTRLKNRLNEDRDSIIALVRDMVRIPSENPPGDTTELFRFVTGYLGERGIDVDVVAPNPTLPNLIATVDGAAPGKHLVLNGHLDIFPAGDPSLWSVDPYSGHISDGKLYGRGVTDMKTGTAASILTFIYLSELREHLRGKLTLTAVSDEETFGPWGARYLIEHRPDVLGDCVLSGEPSTPHVVRFGERGFLWLELTARTKGGHGGYPQMSANAVKIAARVIEALEAVSNIEVSTPPELQEWISAARDGFDAELGPGSSDNLTRVTMSIGSIHGGMKVNMIAADCTLEVDIRCPVGVSTEEAQARVDQILRNFPEASYTVMNRSEPNWVAPDHELVRIVRQNAGQIRGIRPFPNMSLGGTDCRLWRLRGIPAVVYGPNPYNMASPDEYVTIEDLLSTVHVHVLSSFDYLTQ
jgi:succinyl-diaminopimelate desuccinylase